MKILVNETFTARNQLYFALTLMLCNLWINILTHELYSWFRENWVSHGMQICTVSCLRLEVEKKGNVSLLKKNLQLLQLTLALQNLYNIMSDTHTRSSSVRYCFFSICIFKLIVYMSHNTQTICCGTLKRISNDLILVFVG